LRSISELVGLCLILFFLALMNFSAAALIISEILLPAMKRLKNLAFINGLQKKIPDRFQSRLQFTGLTRIARLLREELATLACTILAIPQNKGLDEFRGHLWQRYVSAAYPRYNGRKDIESGDRLITYLERIIDRQVNKAIGILPFNSLLIVIIAIEFKRLQERYETIVPYSMKFTYGLCLCSLVLSSVLLLAMFWVHWCSIPHYRSFSDETDQTIRIIRKRSVMLNVAIMLSVGCLIGMAVLISY
jgi:hypothetical protein